MTVALSRSFKRHGEGNYFEVTLSFDPVLVVESAEFHSDRNGTVRKIVKQISSPLRSRRGDLYSSGVIFWQLVAETFLFRASEVEEAYSLGESLESFVRGRQQEAGGVSSKTHAPKALVTKFLPLAVEEILDALFRKQSVEFAAIFEIQMRAYR